MEKHYNVSLMLSHKVHEENKCTLLLLHNLHCHFWVTLTKKCNVDQLLLNFETQHVLCIYPECNGILIIFSLISFLLLHNDCIKLRISIHKKID
jgi:hypothetical protein